ncbi:hypothetical protein [Lactobacillus crispatus]|uniref:hypothetical protein n=1 Tax=Lactobacillus crispatus TaxID=47770 RepID=UPI00103D448C|nr:hypothetical protein [Lactobacillus crispatus]
MAKNNRASQAELQTAGYDAIRNFRHAIFAETEVSNLARVIRYDRKNHLADIQPLANMSDGSESAQYLDVPVVENCYIIDEMIDALKSEFEKVDENSKLPEHAATSFVAKLPKKRLLRPGIVVVYVVLDRDSDNWSRDATTFTPGSTRMHDANDAIIIGIWGGDWKNG